MMYLSFVKDTIRHTTFYKLQETENEKELIYQLPQDEPNNKRFVNWPSIVEHFSSLIESQNVQEDDFEVKMYYEKYKNETQENFKFYSSLFLISRKKNPIDADFIKRIKKTTLESIQSRINSLSVNFKTRKKEKVLEKQNIFRIKKSIEEKGHFIVSNTYENEASKLLLCDFFTLFKSQTGRNDLFLALNTSQKEKNEYWLYGNKDNVNAFVENLKANQNNKTLKDRVANFIAQHIPKNDAQLDLLPLELRELINVKMSLYDKKLP